MPAETLPITAYVCAMDVQGVYSSVGPQAESLTGFTSGEWTARPRLWLERLHPEDRARVLPALSRARRSAGPFVLEYRLVHRDGSARWIRDESRRVVDESGKAAIHGTWTDITAEKARERESADRGLALTSSREDVDQFVSVASHELGPPLRRIATLTDLLVRRCAGELDPQSLEMLRRVAAAASGAQRLLAGLVHYAEQGRGTPEPADLEAAFDAAAAELRDAAAACGAKFIRGPLPEVWAEPALMSRVFYNLLDNSLKFRSAEPPIVRVWAEPAGSAAWTVCVRDNGVGLEPRQAERVFFLFERLGRPGEGLGLGLAVCRKIVERFGGRIWVESEPGVGSTFRFTLPAASPGPR